MRSARFFLRWFVDNIIYGAYLFDVRSKINVKQKILIKFTTYSKQRERESGASNSGIPCRCPRMRTNFVHFCIWCENILSLVCFPLWRMFGETSQSLYLRFDVVTSHRLKQYPKPTSTLRVFSPFFVLCVFCFLLRFNFIEFTCNDIVTNNTMDNFSG